MQEQAVPHAQHVHATAATGAQVLTGLQQTSPDAKTLHLDAPTAPRGRSR
jgi:hypothetical protein